MKNKMREEEEKLTKLKEEAEEDSRIFREQNELGRKLSLEDDARIAFRKNNKLKGFNLDRSVFDTKP